MQQTKDSKEKVRVFALARILGVDSKTVIDLCKSLGFDVKSQLASLEPEQVDALKQRIARGGKSATPEPPKPVAPTLPPKDKKIVHLVGKPKLESRAEQEHVPQGRENEEIDNLAPLPSVSLLAESNSAPEEAQIVDAASVMEIDATKKMRSIDQSIKPLPELPSLAETANSNAESSALHPLTAAAELNQDEGQASDDTDALQSSASGSPSNPVAPKLPTVSSGRMPNLSGGGRPSVIDRPRAPAGGSPRTIPSSGGATPSGTGASSSAPSAQRPGGAVSPAKPGTPGTPGRPGAGVGGSGSSLRDSANRHRRSDSDRKPGAAAQPVARAPLADPKKPIGNQTKFTLEQLQALREGRSVTDVLNKKPSGPPGAPIVQAPGGKPGEETEELDEDGKKKVPGKVVGRDTRHADRAKRQEQRKVRQSSIVIQGGHVDIEEEAFGTKRGRRPKAILKKRLPGTVERKGKVPITLPISVRSLSEAIGMKVGELLNKLKDLTSSLYNINSPLDIEVAELIATEKGVEFEITKPKDAEQDLLDEHVQAGEDESKFEPRAPVVTIMGHVDHGKTSLLDKIRVSNIVDTEAGGITQVIRAWRVLHNGKPITFLDTPGHEAFTKMRARGANVTDIVVIVVAANDGVMPQTEEAINHAKAAGVSIVVAINKVDLPDSNIKRTEQQLYGLGLIPDNMGGDCQFVHTSATKGLGIDELLETLSLVAELKELKANPHKRAMGTCLEANLSGDEGVMATLLVQQGTLHRGDIIICGASHGRVRAMYDDQGNPILEAGPSIPVRITGLDDVPNADDHFHVLMDLSKAREIAERRKERAQESQFKPRESIKIEKLGEIKIKIAELKVVLKAEARGSVEAIRKELEKLVHDEVRVRLLHAGIGAITESDVQLALASPEDTIVVGFNVVPDDNAMRLAEERSIPIREYNIIYKLTEDIKAALEGKLKPREEVIHLGRALIREVFKISRVGTVAGCFVTQGTIERSAKIRIIRDGAVVYPSAERVASLESLKRFKEDVREVREGYDCGMKVAGYDDIKVNDVIEAYRIEQVQRTLLDR